MQCDLDDQREIPYHLEKWRKQAKNRVTDFFLLLHNQNVTLSG